MEYNLQKILNHYVVHLKLTQYFNLKKKKEFEAKKKIEHYQQDKAF